MAYNDFGSQPSQSFKGNWKCADCGTEITSLPFQPNPERTSNLRCRDCHKKWQATRGPRRW